MFKHSRGRLLVALCALLMGATSLAHAEASLDKAEAPFWMTVSNKRLDKLRGGFDLGLGMVVSFGISRATYINQELVTNMTLQLGDLSKLTASQAKQLGEQINLQPQIVQNGSGNVVDSGAITLPLGTYVQNSLNNQVLRTQTVIDITTNGLGVLKNANFQTMMQEALTNALGRR
jgi:hypothetical protein